MTSAKSLLEVYRDRAFELALDHSRDIHERITSGHTERCLLCNDPGGKLKPDEINLSAELHNTNCRECGDTILFVRYSVIVEKHSAFSYSRIQTLHNGHGDCKPQLVYRPTKDTLLAETKFRTEITRTLNTRIEKHHVSYEPEITIPLCKSCHDKVHSEGNYNALQADMKRSEWIETD